MPYNEILREFRSQNLGFGAGGICRLGADARKRDSISHVADWVQSNVSVERSATEIRYYDPELVPGFFQAEFHARAILATSGRTVADVLVADRLERRSLLTRVDLIEVVIVLSEAALRRRLGSPAVVLKQFEHLAAMNNRSIFERWRKTSRSQGDANNYVELVHVPGTVAVRDSKNPPGLVVAFGVAELDGFLADAKSGRFEVVRPSRIGNHGHL